MRIVVVGVGQIGGSLLLRARDCGYEVKGIDVGDALEATGADIVVVATPIEVTLALVPKLLQATSAVVLDAMSIKRAVHAAAQRHPRFVGGHPMFGSEQNGFAHAHAAAVIDAPFVLTATDETSLDARQTAEAFVTALGARPIWRTPEAHDQEMARVSHVPQLVASALALLAEDEPASWELQGPAFRDMTRIAASPTDMWSQVIAHNDAVGPALTALAEILQRKTLLADARAVKLRTAQPHVGMLADRVAESSTGAMLTRVMQMKAEGRAVLGLHVGEPQLTASPEVSAIVRDVLATAPICYTATQGLPALRERVAAIAQRVSGRAYKTDDVIVTVGAKQALHLALCALVAPGEEVIVPAPAWVSFVELVKLAGGRPVVVPTEWKLTPEALRAAITPKTRALILNTPNNPTGAVYTREELAALLKVADAHGLWLLSDELYRCYVWTGVHVSPVALYERAIWMDGISKSHAMTGLRVGYAAGPRDVIARMRRLASHETSAAPSVSQHAAAALLERFPDGDPVLIRSVAERRRQVQAVLGTACPMDGAFYAWVAGDRATELLARDVAVMPGAAFGSPGYMRIAYATESEPLARALSLMA